jgi:organic hydroperoxide reductase OsmC/OhrA
MQGASRWHWPFDCKPLGTLLRSSIPKQSSSRSALTLRASVPNLDQDTFDRFARDAERNCPVSRVLKTEITLDAQLVI